jgi:hypothetical protein
MTMKSKKSTGSSSKPFAGNGTKGSEQFKNGTSGGK